MVTLHDANWAANRKRECFPMNIIICDDNKAFTQLLHSKIIDYFAQIDKQCECQIFTSPEALLNSDLSAAHVVFLDVDMPGLNGIDTARELRKVYPDLYLVFVTGWIQYAPAGYCVNAFRYLLKQRLNEELFSCIDAIRDKMTRNQERICLYGREAPFEIMLDEIVYFEGSSYRMVQLHSISDKIIECKGKLSEIEALLKNSGFLRIQKSFIVNMRYILQIKNYKAVLVNGASLKTTERGYSQICSEFIIWKGQQL